MGQERRVFRVYGLDLRDYWGLLGGIPQRWCSNPGCGNRAPSGRIRGIRIGLSGAPIGLLALPSFEDSSSDGREQAQHFTVIRLPSEEYLPAFKSAAERQHKQRQLATATWIVTGQCKHALGGN